MVLRRCSISWRARRWGEHEHAPTLTRRLEEVSFSTGQFLCCKLLTGPVITLNNVRITCYFRSNLASWVLLFSYSCFLKTRLPFVFRAAMKMANIDQCFDFMFTNPKDSEGVSVERLKCAVLNFCWITIHSPVWTGGDTKPLIFRNLWRRTARVSFCTLVTSAQGLEAFQSTSCGRDVGMPRALVWHSKDPVTSNWKISTQPRASCLSLITVC